MVVVFCMFLLAKIQSFSETLVALPYIFIIYGANMLLKAPLQQKRTAPNVGRLSAHISC